MADRDAALTVDDVASEGLDDWRFVLGRLRTVLATGDFATGAALVARVAEVADELDHHPDVALSYPEVVVSTYSHDSDAVTWRDVALARRISELAAQAGVEARPQDVVAVEWGLDVADGVDLRGVYGAVLGGEVRENEIHDPHQTSDSVWFQEADPAYRPADGVVEQRWHPDVWVPVELAEARVATVVAAGGRVVDDSYAPSFWVLADPQGNRMCVCTDADRG